jgi:small-conductance mechanosensitive channel
MEAMNLALLAAPFAHFLDQEFLGHPLRNWLYAVITFVVTVFVLDLVKRVVEHRLAKIAERTETDVDDLVVDLIRRTRQFFVFAVGLYFAHHWLSLSDNLELWIGRIVTFAICFQIGLWGIGIVDFGIHRMVRGRPADDPARTMGTSVLGFVARIFVWTLILLTFLQAVGANVSALLASLGVGGIAVALALQNILGDLFASITILLDKPFVVGDSIVIGDFNGTIEKIGVKSTRLRSVSGEEIIIGNQDLVSSRVRNFKRMRERRQVFTVGVTYDTPRPKVEKIALLLKEIVTSVPDTRFDRANFKSFGSSSLDFEVVYFVQKPDYNTLMEVQQRINLAILERFAEEQVEFAFPTQTVHHVSVTPAPVPGVPATAKSAS